jgi:spermidine synthase
VALPFIFFLSGAAALIFETLWFRQAGLAFGNSVWASSLVLTAFMAGLALGNGLAARHGARVRRPVRLYALIEVAIAAAGVALVWLLPVLGEWMAPVLRRLSERPWMLNALRLGLAFVLLLVPCAAMGATLPLLVRALRPGFPRFGEALGRLYGWNTLGAVAGALAGEAWLISLLGVRGTATAAGALGLVCAGLSLLVSRRTETVASEAPAPEAPSRAPRRLLAAAALAGGILLALEVVWFRFLSLFTPGAHWSFTIMLASVLLGIGLGSLAASLWLRRRADAVRSLAPVALLALAATVIAYAAFQLAGRDRLVAVDWRWHVVALRALGLMLPVSVVSGVLFTLLGEAVQERVGGDVRAAGLLTLANTAGAAAGSLLGGFLLLPLLGMERSFFVLAAAYAAVALLARSPRGSRGLELASWALGAALLAAFPFGLMERGYFAAVEQRFTRGGARLIAAREGLTETIHVFRRDRLDEPESYRLVTNGFSMSATTLGGRRYMKLYVYWPVAVHPGIKRALLISYGVGSTAAALRDTGEIESIDVVDLSRDVLGLSGLFVMPPGKDPLKDPRVRVHVEDGRHFLQTTARRFDLITAEPPPPKNAGIENLYSREYFRLLRSRLADGGIATYWLPVHALRPVEALAIIHGFCDAFDDCSLWKGSELELMLVGTRGAAGPVSEERFGRQWSDPATREEIRRVGFEAPEQLGATFVGDASWLRALAGATPPLDDEHPHRLLPQFRPRVVDAAEIEFRRGLLDAGPARERFAASELVRRLWPPGLRERSLPFFAYQQLIDDGFWLNLSWQPPSARAIDRVDDVLRRTSLRTLPLWLMGSSPEEQAAAARHVARHGTAGMDETLGIGAMADRDYARAEGHFRAALEAQPADYANAHRRIYALFLTGREADAIALARGLPAEHAPFRQWLEGRRNAGASAPGGPQPSAGATDAASQSR